jgi:hypothetical protein
MANDKGQIDTFIAKYSPDVARQFRAARAHVRRLFPRGHELVYDNYNAFGCGFSPTPRTSDIVVSVVAYPKWVTLFFFHGKHLRDPESLLQGSGVRIRSIRLQPPSLLNSQAVADLLAQVLAKVGPELAAAPRLSATIRSVSVRQRPRRPGMSKSKAVEPRGRRRAA